MEVDSGDNQAAPDNVDSPTGDEGEVQVSN